MPFGRSRSREVPASRFSEALVLLVGIRETYLRTEQYLFVNRKHFVLPRSQPANGRTKKFGGEPVVSPVAGDFVSCLTFL